MKNPFKSTAKTVAYDPRNPPVSDDGWDPKHMRDVVFDTLATRFGPELTATLREDFDQHLANDPLNGTEAAWMCLCGKLVETVDRFNDMLGGGMVGDHHQSGSTTVSPFTTFRKDG